MDNERKEFVYTDSSDVEHKIHLTSTSFNFAQKDKSIHDTKFLTKPTTFIKDAFKRFCKNKSSVAGAIILGILLLGSLIIPIAVPYSLDVQHPLEQFLEPKLFPTGTGFWDGTKRMTDVPVDPETIEVVETSDGPVEYGYPYEEFDGKTLYPKNSVLNRSPVRTGYTDKATSSAVGGFVNLINDNELFTDGDESVVESKTVYMQSPEFSVANIDSAMPYRLEISFLKDEVENYSIGDYGVFITYNAINLETSESTAYEIALKDYDDTPSYTSDTLTDEVGNTVNTESLVFEDCLSSIKENEEIDKTSSITARVVLRLRPNLNSSSSLFIQKVNLYNGELLVNNVSWSDANTNVLAKKDDENYWSSTGVKNLYHGITRVCDFTFDTYAVPYGNRVETVSLTQLREYIEKGWLKEELLPVKGDGSYDTSVLSSWVAEVGQGQEAPEILTAKLTQYYTDSSSDYLPIVSLRSIRGSSAGSLTSYSLTCVVSGYKALGYTSQPIFLLGTDNYGYDMLKRVFTGLLTSLGLGILVFAVCFSFGLVYGAICGYFGGNIDIALQRFCDLLSGIPRIVIMTLCILNLGSNFGTFILAMCMTGWIGTASLTRTQFYRFRDREYTLASRTLGASNFRLIFKHILPNAMGTIITSAVLMIPSVIFTEATISYLGLGFQDMQSLGVILSDNQTYLNSYSYLILFPSVIMALIMISFNLFGNGLRDAFNPSLKGSD